MEIAVRAVEEFEVKWTRLEKLRGKERKTADDEKEIKVLAKWIKDNSYGLFKNNCEQNATYWRNEQHVSQQVRQVY